jgi:hypothetical protein
MAEVVSIPLMQNDVSIYPLAKTTKVYAQVYMCGILVKRKCLAGQKPCKTFVVSVLGVRRLALHFPDDEAGSKAQEQANTTNKPPGQRGSFGFCRRLGWGCGRGS